MNLIVVDSEEKARRFRSVIDSAQRIMVVPSPVRRLVPGGLHLNVTGRIEERYGIQPGFEEAVKAFANAARDAQWVLVASSPGCAGEAQAWHLAQCLPHPEQAKVQRLDVPALNKQSVRRALARPRSINPHLIDAWRVREIIELLTHEILAQRLRREKLPVDKGPQLTMVELAILRILATREQQLHSQSADHHRQVSVQLEIDGHTFRAYLHSDPVIIRDTNVYALIDHLQEPDTTWHIEALEEREVSETPPRPFTTSTLLQTAVRLLDLSPTHTEEAARILYEKGLITHYHTTSLYVCPKAKRTASRVIKSLYGQETQLNADRLASCVEAIRPANIALLPEWLSRTELANSGLSTTAGKLYDLIWRHFIASRMAPARDRVLTVTIRPCWTGSREPWEDPDTYPHPFTFSAHLTQSLFKGHRVVFQESEYSDEPLGDAQLIKILDKGDKLRVNQIRADEANAGSLHPYTLADLIEELFAQGLGHPETTAARLENLFRSGYIHEVGGRLHPAPHGDALLSACQEHLPSFCQPDNAARIASLLERVEQGALSRHRALEAFVQLLAPDELKDAQSAGREVAA